MFFPIPSEALVPLIIALLYLLVILAIMLGIILLGLYFYRKGFRIIRRSRLIRELPQSTIRALAMGLVELRGKPLAEPFLHSPLTNTACIYYKYVVEEYLIEGKGLHQSYKKVIVRNTDQWIPFTLDDGTGTVPVDPQKATWAVNRSETYVLRQPYDRRKVLEAIYADDVHTFPLERLEKSRNWLLKSPANELRFTQWCITADEDVYVMGTAAHDKEKNLVITKGQEEFVISDKSEKSILRTTLKRAWWALIGGIALLLLGLTLLLRTFM